MVSTTISPAISRGLAAQVVRTNEIDERTEALYNDMIKSFEVTTQWPSGHTIRLRTGKCRGNPTVISLRNASGWIVCNLIVNGKTQYQSRFTVGYYDADKGRWMQSQDCTLPAFHSWRRRCTVDINRLEKKGKL